VCGLEATPASFLGRQRAPTPSFDDAGHLLYGFGRERMTRRRDGPASRRGWPRASGRRGATQSGPRGRRAAAPIPVSDSSRWSPWSLLLREPQLAWRRAACPNQARTAATECSRLAGPERRACQRRGEAPAVPVSARFS